MCGRFARWRENDEILLPFDTVKDNKTTGKSFNIAPGADILAVIRKGNARVMTALKWGLVPYWAKDLKSAKPLINARGETVREKPSFRQAFRSGRCVILADGFYEWKRDNGSAKIPYFFRLKSGRTMAFAGIADTWDKDGKPIETAAIVTTQANELMAPVHDRMPVILPEDRLLAWLDASDTDGPEGMLAPYPASEMEAYPVSPLVNSPKNDSADCIRKFD